MKRKEAVITAAKLRKLGRNVYAFRDGNSWVIAQGRLPSITARKDDMMYHAYRY